MKDIEKYYKNTENAGVHVLLEKFINMNVKIGKAIDLGCGIGRDTIFLIKNNWNVLSIDRENTEKVIIGKLNKEEQSKFRFKCGNFEDIELERNDLVVANFSIPFCDKKLFNQFWGKIKTSISKGGYFVGNFFGNNDSWKNIKDEMVFLSKEQVLSLFEDFEILEFEEIEKDGKTGLGKIKHWHIYNVIARKKD